MTAALLTVDEIAAELRISKKYAYQVVQSMPHMRIGRSIRVLVEDFKAYQEQRKVNPWGRSSKGAKRGGATGSTRAPASDTGKPSERETVEWPESDSSKPSWVRPLKRDVAND